MHDLSGRLLMRLRHLGPYVSSRDRRFRSAPFFVVSFFNGTFTVFERKEQELKAKDAALQDAAGENCLKQTPGRA